MLVIGMLVIGLVPRFAPGDGLVLCTLENAVGLGDVQGHLVEGHNHAFEGIHGSAHPMDPIYEVLSHPFQGWMVETIPQQRGEGEASKLMICLNLP